MLGLGISGLVPRQLAEKATYHRFHLGLIKTTQTPNIISENLTDFKIFVECGKELNHEGNFNALTPIVNQ